MRRPEARIGAVYDQLDGPTRVLPSNLGTLGADRDVGRDDAVEYGEQPRREAQPAVVMRQDDRNPNPRKPQHQHGPRRMSVHDIRAQLGESLAEGSRSGQHSAPPAQAERSRGHSRLLQMLDHQLLGLG
jgi:hypothetical protein